MKGLFITLLFFTLITSAKAQFVTISDTAMVSYLTANYSNAMVGNQMDTTDLGITNQTFFWVNGIDFSNMDGLQYFDNVTSVSIENCLLDSIIAFPPNVTVMSLNFNNLISIPALPIGLQALQCTNNQIIALPLLPNSLFNLYCDHNNLTFLPNLPSSLFWLSCSHNNLTVLPVLPSVLTELHCYSNNLTGLPFLPDSIVNLYCEDNNLAVLPQLPANLQDMDASLNSNLNCLPILPETLQNLEIISTNISCLPNYPSQLVSIDVQGLPFCLPGGSNGCVTSGSISGAVFDNLIGNCANSANQTSNTTFQLFDSQNNFLQSISSNINDYYYFSVQPGAYSVRIDSSFINNSVSLSCPPSGEHLVSAVLDSIYADRDFGFNCIGIDIGVEAIVHQGIVFPGQPHSIKAIAGDLSNYFGLGCASGTGGTVQLTVTGPVSYTGIPPSSMTPTSVSGNTYLYSINDFATTNIDETFVLNFLTNTTAQAGDVITVTVTVTSNSLDLDSSNNTLAYDYVVVNSYDPNMKEVYPVDVIEGYEDYFTFTVHFQNLGTAPAFNIRIKDTLDQNLDLKTLRVINASHDYSYNLTDELLSVYFQNIMLADSASDPEGSKGFIQYQVKPKAHLPQGATIENTAHIFFDYNPAVVTNTTTNNFNELLSLEENSKSEFSLYPNPSSGHIVLVNQNIGNETLIVRIRDLMGKTLVNEPLDFINGVSSLNTNLVSGSYFMIIENGAGVLSSSKLVIRK